jgi:beta-lactamase class D
MKWLGIFRIMRGYNMRRLIYLFLTLPLLAVEPDFGKFDGTVVIIELNTSAKTIYGKHADERVNPCSTFKILNSMIALDSGVVQDENETIKWDGIVREYPAWNQDHSMRTAISVSTVWFYQELARRVGVERMARIVAQTHYGNGDTSHTLTDFWLGGGSLLISPTEEAEFLKALVEEKLPFSKHSMKMTKDIITLKKDEQSILAGKTGSCNGIGWFVGFIKHNDDTQVFSFQIRGDGANGAEAKKIALEYLKN